MNMPNKASFGVTPPEIHTAVVGALNRIEEKPRVRFRAATVVMAALLVMLLAVTAYAIVNRAGIHEFFTSWNQRNGYTAPETFIHSVGGEKPLLHENAGDLEVTVTEALGDGEDYFFITTVSLPEGKEGHLVNLASLENGLTSAPTYSDGLPIYYIHTEVMYEDYGAMTFDWIENEDGSISFFSDNTIVPSDTDASMSCMVTYAKCEDGMLPLPDEFETVLLPFTLPGMK